MRQDLVSRIDLDGEEITGVAIIFTGDGNLQVFGITERIPGSQYVKPRKKQGNDDKKEQQACRHDTAADFGEVIFNNRQGIPHYFSPSVVSEAGDAAMV